MSEATKQQIELLVLELLKRNRPRKSIMAIVVYRKGSLQLVSGNKYVRNGDLPVCRISRQEINKKPYQQTWLKLISGYRRVVPEEAERVLAGIRVKVEALL